MEEIKQFNFEVLLIRWFRFIRKNIWLLLIFCVVGMGLAYLYNSSQKTYYGSKAVVYSSLVKDFRIEQIIEDLSSHLEKESYGTLAKMLNMPVEDAKNLRTITVKTLEVKPSIKTDPTLVFNDYLYNVMEVTIIVLDTSAIKPFQEGLQYYMNNNPFLSKIKKNRNDNLNNMIKKVDEQISNLEMLQKNYVENQSESKDGLTINNEPNTGTKDMVYLLELKANYQEDLILETIEYIKPFFVPEKPESKKMAFLAAGFMLGLFLGLGFAVVRKINSMY